MSYRTRQMIEADWPRVAEIYQQGIDTGEATFECATQLLAGMDEEPYSRLQSGCGKPFAGGRMGLFEPSVELVRLRRCGRGELVRG